jgi:hypothetical protein
MGDAVPIIDRDRLPHWVIYDHPSDHPELYVARLFYSLPQPEATKIALGSKRLEPLRMWLSGYGYVRLDRDPEDDATIVEVWLV